jgi:ribosomal protein S18 acetylase RimI-like enzyme
VGTSGHAPAPQAHDERPAIGDDDDVMRDFTPGDQTAVRELVLGGMRERWGDAYDPSANPDLDDISASYINWGAEVVVVDIEGEIVATGTLLPERNRRGRIVRMSVDGAHRRTGFGRQVVEELVRRARRRGMFEVVVLTDTPWTSAIALYRSLGFDYVSQDDTDTRFALRL